MSQTSDDNTHECWLLAVPSETNMMQGSRLDASVPQTLEFCRYLPAITTHHHQHN